MKTTTKGRKFGGTKLRTVYYIVPEGRCSEDIYLNYVQNKGWLRDKVKVSIKQPSARNIQAFIEKAEDVEAQISSEDYIWIILDRDAKTHTPEQFAKLNTWEQGNSHRGVALTTPRFEYWLLLHFGESHAQARANSPKDKQHAKNYPNLFVLKDKKLSYLNARLTDPAPIRAAISVCNAQPALPSCTSYDIVGSSMATIMERLLP